MSDQTMVVIILISVGVLFIIGWTVYVIKDDNIFNKIWEDIGKNGHHIREGKMIKGTAHKKKEDADMPELWDTPPTEDK